MDERTIWSIRIISLSQLIRRKLSITSPTKTITLFHKPISSIYSSYNLFFNFLKKWKSWILEKKEVSLIKKLFFEKSTKHFMKVIPNIYLDVDLNKKNYSTSATIETNRQAHVRAHTHKGDSQWTK